jgi:S-adenosylmethionine hydrolase
MITGSAGFLEVAAFQSSAKEILGIGAGTKIRLVVD